MIKDAGSDAYTAVAALREVLRRHGRLVLKPTGESMGKLYQWADAIVIEAMPARALQIGSIVVFPRREHWVAHRVVYRCGRGTDALYLTCGDAAGCPDADRATHGAAVGVVTEVRSAARVVNLRSTMQRIRARLCAARSLAVAMLRHPGISIRRLSLSASDQTSKVSKASKSSVAK